MGNSCGCSDNIKEERSLENSLVREGEEVVEFHPDLFKHLSRSPVTAVDMPSSHEKSQSLVESKQSTQNCENFPAEIQGELLKVQFVNKEILVPRWCILNQKVFKYYKSQYSAIFKEKALFEIPHESIVKARAYSNSGKHFLEICYVCDNFFTSRSNFSLNSVMANQKKVKNDRKNSSYDKNQETIVFLVENRGEWEQ